MDKVKVILVEPLYQINLGYAARVLKNFDIKTMNLVSPRCKYRGKEAIKYSKHAVDLLKAAKVYKSIDDATKDSDIVIGTTGIWHKGDKSFFNIYVPSVLPKLTLGKKRIALLIGRDDTGLSKEELQMCDASIYVPTSREYPILNISHALAIMLYELNRKKLSKDYNLGSFYADTKRIQGISKLFAKSIKDRKDIRNKKAVQMAFDHIIRRSGATKGELNALSIGLKGKL